MRVLLRRLLFATAIILTGFVAGLAQSVKPLFSVTISAPGVVAVGSELKFRVTFTNTSNQLISLPREERRSFEFRTGQNRNRPDHFDETLRVEAWHLQDPGQSQYSSMDAARDCQVKYHSYRGQSIGE